MQLPLNIQLFPETTFANFTGRGNEVLLHVLKNQSNTEPECIYVWGDTGSGKTHLLQASCHAAKTLGLECMYLSFQNGDLISPSVLENLEYYDLIALDDIDVVTNKSDFAEALFHLYNRIQQTGHRLLLSAQNTVKNISICLDDLRSRLSAAAIFHIHSLTDDDKKQIIHQRANQNGLFVGEEVVEFLLRRCSRDLPSLLNALEALDRASLVSRRKLTLPFVKEVLGKTLMAHSTKS